MLITPFLSLSAGTRASLLIETLMTISSRYCCARPACGFCSRTRRLIFSSQDLIVYSESIESKLRVENANLVSRIRDTELSLEDATRSRRELQQQVRQLEVYRDAVLQDHNYLKVAPLAGDAGDCSLSWQNSNPYVIALLDGDCLLVRSLAPKTPVLC